MIRKLFESVRGTLWGCAVTILVLMVLVVPELVLFGLLDLTPNLKTYSWLIAVCVGGHFACRQAKVFLWLNWTVFAVILELFVVLDIPDANKTLSALYPNADPATIQWHYSTMLVLTIPAALIGAIIWIFTTKRVNVRPAVDDAAGDP